MKKNVFIHLPKTGGSSFLKIESHRRPARFFKMDEVYSQNDTYIDHDLRAPDFKFLKEYAFSSDSFIFCFVRNPWDRILSSYCYLKNNADTDIGNTADQKDFNLYFKKFKTFKDMLLNWDDEFHNQIHFKPQHQWICDDEDKIIPNYIGKFENLQEDFNRICDKIGTPHKQLPHINKTKHKHYTEYYNDETKQIIGEKYAQDIEYFGYEFGQ